MPPSTLPSLSALEARVLGVLIEKQLTTPDYYPLTMNALLAGCNQKTSRNPVMTASEAEIEMTLDGLKRHTLLIETYGASGRVLRYAHNVPKVLNLGQAMTALLAVLMLRGPLTPGELRIGCDRLYKFADISSVEAYLEDMATRSAGALVVKLAKQPGSREYRWAHLLSGGVEGAAETLVSEEGEERASAGEIAALKSDLAQIHDEMIELRGLVERLYEELHVKR